MNTEQKIKEIASQYMLRLEQWRDEYKHWRVGIEWYSESRYLFICECPTLEECLDKVIEFMKINPPLVRSEEQHEK